jgi:hypothetical protein
VCVCVPQVVNIIQRAPCILSSSHIDCMHIRVYHAPVLCLMFLKEKILLNYTVWCKNMTFLKKLIEMAIWIFFFFVILQCCQYHKLKNQMVG